MAGGAVDGFRRSFSSAGRCSVPRFSFTAILCVAVIWLCNQTHWTQGIAFDALAGGIAGTAFAKLVVEAIKRLRDAGHDPRMLTRIAVALTAAALIVGTSAFSGEHWAETPATVLAIAVPAIAAIALLWPGHPSRPGDVRLKERRSWAFVTLCIVGGAAAAGWLAWFEAGMAENAHRMDAWSHAHRSEESAR